MEIAFLATGVGVRDSKNPASRIPGDGGRVPDGVQAHRVGHPGGVVGGDQDDGGQGQRHRADDDAVVQQAVQDLRVQGGGGLDGVHDVRPSSNVWVCCPDGAADYAAGQSFSVSPTLLT
ncbi:hypothetical protein [Nocardia seriolae]|uniref:hypothetical protein n=1 Tax=Nocardia seriolae TaxID=37332 RepID=UPI00351FA90F